MMARSWLAKPLNGAAAIDPKRTLKNFSNPLYGFLKFSLIVVQGLRD